MTPLLKLFCMVIPFIIAGCASPLKVTVSGTGSDYTSALNNALLNASKSVGVEVTNVRTTTNGNLSEQLATSSNGVITEYTVLDNSIANDLQKVTIIATVKPERLVTKKSSDSNNLSSDVDKYRQLAIIANTKQQSFRSYSELLPTHAHWVKSNVTTHYNQNIVFKYDIEVVPYYRYWDKLKEYGLYIDEHVQFDKSIYGMDTVHHVQYAIDFIDRSGQTIVSNKFCKDYNLYGVNYNHFSHISNAYDILAIKGTYQIAPSEKNLIKLKQVDKTIVTVNLVPDNQCKTYKQPSGTYQYF